MSFGFLERLRKTIGFRLTLWYAAIFILSSLALFILAYLFLASSLRQKDHELILSKLKEFEVQYRTGGLKAIRREVKLEQDAGKPNTFFIRLADSANRTIFLNLPDQWADFDLKSLENGAGSRQGWTRLKSKDDENGLEIATTQLANSTILQVGKNTESREDLLENFRGIFFGGIMVIIVLGFSVGQFLTRRALRPIRKLIFTVRTIADTGKVAARMPDIHTGDELDELSGLVNLMLARIETLINGMKETLDNVAHDLRTPMTRLRGMAEMALAGAGPLEACREALADCLEESERVMAMLNTLMDISEAETGTMTLKLEQVNLPELLTSVIELYRYVAEDKRIEVQAAYPLELQLTGDRERLRQTLANLLDNAIKYTPDGGQVAIEVLDQPQQVLIRIKDSGPGIALAEIPRIWDRLYRGDQSRSQRGLGLGLSLVKAIIIAHHGQVEVASQPGTGSVFTVFLPKQLSITSL
ncbi:MAG: ATP-binding protein [Syntrophobacterales bacterium]|jgi:signal transduction histidine kinase|nr:ATP-binding protein [Syntrophobacterales bacterium]